MEINISSEKKNTCRFQEKIALCIMIAENILQYLELILFGNLQSKSYFIEPQC